jgi:hypothetical protein
MNDYRIKGAFFETEGDTGPAFTGFVEIDGVKTNIALWPKTSAKGQNYLQVSEDKKKQAASSRMRSPFDRKPAITRNDDPDDFSNF